MSRVTLKYDADAQADQSSLDWRKSSLCPNNATCVEVAALPDGGRAVRDGKNPAGPSLAFGATAWSEFLAAARAGKFDGGR
ncbi:DUF397 domain-containing protein [Actinospica sp.]|jgi:hypothetical protein|uniref:DUF397 domain-containing protein n=1 Tax=Actinospica sp. TaxID=1872142 RepID=UPI002B52CF08|nr:DUF397 domain-containing protein [Actinospica sp.]HWG22832.1 DUF397 domain-containing protein [Actinospica sp.]